MLDSLWLDASEDEGFACPLTTDPSKAMIGSRQTLYALPGSKFGRRSLIIQMFRSALTLTVFLYSCHSELWQVLLSVVILLSHGGLYASSNCFLHLRPSTAPARTVEDSISTAMGSIRMSVSSIGVAVDSMSSPEGSTAGADLISTAGASTGTVGSVSTAAGASTEGSVSMAMSTEMEEVVAFGGPGSRWGLEESKLLMEVGFVQRASCTRTQDLMQ